MSTKSSYSSNKLNQVIENGTHHFISKSYVSAKFDHDRKKSEYYLYWVNLKKGVFESDSKYHRMSCKPMNAKEKKYFKSILDEYRETLNNRHGVVWENKKLGFDKTLVVVPQLRLEI
jgi:hypothetical protein